MPKRVGQSTVWVTYFPLRPLMSFRDSHGMSPPSQYPGTRRLGVCPLSKRATSGKSAQDHLGGASVAGLVVTGQDDWLHSLIAPVLPTASSPFGYRLRSWPAPRE